MRKLKAQKSIKKYKNQNAWLDAVYRANKDFIDERLPKKKTSKKTIFKNLVKEYIEEGMTPAKALKTLNKSIIFTPEAERLATNAYSAIKDDPLAYKRFREMTKIGGKYSKVNLSEFKWDKAQKAYIYRDIMIKFDNSPYEIRIQNRYIFT